MNNLVVGAAVALTSFAAIVSSANGGEMQLSNQKSMVMIAHRGSAAVVTTKPRLSATQVVYVPNPKIAPRIAYRMNGRIVIKQVSFLGQSPFLCSASGFGQRSSCRSRT